MVRLVKPQMRVAWNQADIIETIRVLASSIPGGLGPFGHIFSTVRWSCIGYWCDPKTLNSDLFDATVMNRSGNLDWAVNRLHISATFDANFCRQTEATWLILVHEFYIGGNATRTNQLDGEVGGPHITLLGGWSMILGPIEPIRGFTNLADPSWPVGNRSQQAATHEDIK